MSAAAGPNLNSVLRALHGTDITLFYQDSDLKYVWLENPPEGWSEADLIGKSDYEILPKAAADVLIPAKQHVLQTGEKRQLVAPVEAGGVTRWYENWIEPDYDSDGAIIGLLFFIVDVTDKISREESLRQLLLEVSHRSRNLLAIVQSIAGQSLRTQDNETELHKFNERIQSLALTLDVVTADDWDGASLHELLHKQTAPFSKDGAKPIIHGLNPKLTPNAAVHIGLAIQELASINKDHGKPEFNAEDIRISAENISGNSTDFVLEWRQKSLTKSFDENSKNMSSLTLRQVVPSAVGGTAQIIQNEDELIYSLTVPAENLA